MVLCGLDQRAHIFRKARAAETGPRMQELAADAVVEAHTARDLLDVGADLLTEVSNLVDEGNFGREERVGGVFDKLGGAASSVENGHLVETDRPIDFRHHLFGALVLSSDHDAIGMLEIMNGCAFT